MARLFTDLPEGPLAIVGDVHGEIGALEALLAKIAKVAQGPRGLGSRERTVVFVGDLVDRGPDSVAVVRRVAELVSRGRARAVLGNHELNLLVDPHGRKPAKEGNGWFHGRDDHYQLEGGRKGPFASRTASESERAEMLGFFRTLPLVAERDDLRVVHAGYYADAAAALPREGDVAALVEERAAAIEADLRARGRWQAADEERARFAQLKDIACEPTEHLSAVAEVEHAQQARNPIKLLTSGGEIPVEPGAHFFTGGKWRFLTRERWWHAPQDRPTVFGHHWRRRGGPIAGKVDVWDDVPTYGWSGDAFCVDYSVGRRYAERVAGRSDGFDNGLAALLWPERELVFDDRDDRIPTR